MGRTRFDKDYYAILGIPPSVTEDEIRKAYRRQALQWHPDRNRGDRAAEERFKELSEAYAVLIDAAKRREYDAARRAGAPGSFRPSRDDLFRDLFADPRASGIFEDLAREFARMGMRVDRHFFHQTLFGGRTVITGGVFVITPFTPILSFLRLAGVALRGHGHRRTSEAVPEPSGMLGRLWSSGRRLLGLGPASRAATMQDVDIVVPLRLSRAEAQHGVRRRVVLGGGGGRHELLVTIPAGIRAGTKLRLRGQGHLRDGTQPGDAYLAVEIVDEQ